MVMIQLLITIQMIIRVSNNKGLILRRTRKDKNLTVCRNKETKASIQTKEEEETKNNMLMEGQGEAAKIRWMMKKMELWEDPTDKNIRMRMKSSIDMT